MPHASKYKKILIIGSGPITIGQACEFDYAGTTACMALKRHGFEVVLINSNPATIMTDPECSSKTYIEPITPETVATIMAIEKPDALLPTMGGQTALNVTMQLFRSGLLNECAVLGASPSAIEQAEDRLLFRNLVSRLGYKALTSFEASSLEEARQFFSDLSFPIIIRPSFTLGGTGGGIARTISDFEHTVKKGLLCSPVHKILLEQAIVGWKEIELEVIRDSFDRCLCICSMENINPMGVHTGDSIVVTPALTLTDKEIQTLRQIAFSLLRALNIEGGANVQFAINPTTSEIVVIEMNPRVSRSSALASKATGFPIAIISALVAAGIPIEECLSELSLPLEPAIDYVVTKIPRFDFQKLGLSQHTLSTYMQSTGEVMAIGGCFEESLQKAIRSLDQGLYSVLEHPFIDADPTTIQNNLSHPTADLLFWIAAGFSKGLSIEDVHDCCLWDRWFLEKIQSLVLMENNTISQQQFCWYKSKGFSDVALGQALGLSEENVRSLRHQHNIHPSFHRVDSWAGERESKNEYFYATCSPFPVSTKRQASLSLPKVLVLGSGANRIGQGIEFDYCCVRACRALKKLGFSVVMVNCNPETVSTDHTEADRLYLSPLCEEDLLEIVHHEQKDGPFLGAFVQFGGQTSLKLAEPLSRSGIPLLGTPLKSIRMTEDRDEFRSLLQRCGLSQPKNYIARTQDELIHQVSKEIGFPCIVRPSFVLGGHGMKIISSENELMALNTARDLFPILVEEFLVSAREYDVEVLSNGTSYWIAGIAEQFEPAGVHSGDSTCVYPATSLSVDHREKLHDALQKLTPFLNIKGLFNLQIATQEEILYILEINPRASRTVPFLSKAQNFSIIDEAVSCILNEVHTPNLMTSSRHSVKLPCFSSHRFSSVSTVLGPTMKSTGESMGSGQSREEATAKAMEEYLCSLPKNPSILIINERNIDLPLDRLAATGALIYTNSAEIKPLHLALYFSNQPYPIQNRLLEMLHARGIPVWTTMEHFYGLLFFLENRHPQNLSKLSTGSYRSVCH